MTGCVVPTQLLVACSMQCFFFKGYGRRAWEHGTYLELIFDTAGSVVAPTLLACYEHGLVPQL